MRAAGGHGRKHDPAWELFPARITAEEAAVAAPRPLPDENARRAIVESDINFYRNPNALTLKRRAVRPLSSSHPTRRTLG